jgi:hypothetical protein
MRRTFVFPALLLAVVALPAGAQRRSNDAWLRDCRDNDWNEGETFCDVRELKLAARSRLSVDGEQNGGVTVTGWDRNEILVTARIQTHAGSESDARDLAKRIEIDTDGTIRAHGPSTRWRSGWSVSYDIMVPRKIDLDLRTNNGGIHIADVHGRLSFDATNGGVTLNDLAGSVRGETRNGGVHVSLSGTHWDGDGVDVRTQNGGVHIDVPERYSAHLETGTVNGGMTFDFPITVRGSFRRQISTDLGEGGVTVRAMTTNGGVIVRRR